jgi:hypothetical protein
MLRASDVRFTTGNAIELYEDGGRASTPCSRR